MTSVWTGLYSYPGPMAIGPSGNVYLTAKVNNANTLVILSSAGAVLHLTVIPDLDGDPARDIVIDSQGFAYIAPTGIGGYLYVFNASGTLVRTLGQRTAGLEFERFFGLATGPGDTLHVATWDLNDAPVIEKYTSHPAGAEFRYAFATTGSGPMEVDFDGNIYLAAGAGAPQVAKLSRTGSLIASWPTPAWPSAITRGPDGELFISSAMLEGLSSTAQAPGRMRVFSTEGVLLREWAIENGSLNYLRRHAFDQTGTLYVPQQKDRRVLRFGT